MIPARTVSWRWRLWLGIGVAALAVALVLRAALNAPHQGTGPNPVIRLAGDSTGVATVRDAFNAASGHERILALLSPT